MSALLLDQTLTYIRAQFTRAEVAQVLAYGGEFSTDEIDKVGYSCPAIFVTVLGWERMEGGTRLAGVHTRNVSMAAFIAFKHAKREQRMRGAMNLADKLALVLRTWAPSNIGDVPMSIAPLEHDASCENMYSRGVDKVGQAVWLVRWNQAVKPVAPLPTLVDWLAVDIADTVRSGQTPAVAPLPASTLIVTESITVPPN